MTSKKLYIVDWKPDSESKEKVIYTLDLEELEQCNPLDVHDPVLSPLLPLIDRNVTFAAIPENYGEGTACYLLNLNSLEGSARTARSADEED